MLQVGFQLGPYEILEFVGAGGMGEVYRARDTRLGREVAIKVLPAHFSSSPELRGRFEREARTISSLTHPNICRLYDVGHSNGIDYLVLEFLEGESLARRLEKGALPIGEVLRIGREIADALDTAHRAGVVHRDLKPGNVVLTRSGAKLLDFGLAKPQPGPLAAAASQAVATQTSPPSPITQQGVVVGTFQYMSPEQVEGRPADARSDIFALGTVLYEMTTGRRAFDGKSYLSVASAILEKEPEPITVAQPLSPPALDHVVRTCLAKDPEQRYQTAHDVALELKWISETGSQPSLAPVARHRRWRLWLLWAATVVVAVAATLVAGWYWHGREPRPVVRAVITLPADSELGAVDSGVGFSPDGRRLAVTITKGLKASLWLRSLDSKEAQPLAGTDGASYPTWSPDGRSLAFFADHKLKRIDLDTGIVQGLGDAPDGRGVAWGPDNTIVFAPNRLSGLLTVPAGGGVPVELTTRAHAGITHRSPLFLPDGKTVLFFNVVPGQTHGELDAVDLKTKEVKRVLDAESGGRYVAPGYLLYIQAGTLVAQHFDASALKAIGPAIPVAENVRFIATLFTGIFDASSRGDLIYAERASGRNQWTWFDRSGNVLGKVGDPTPLGLTYDTAAMSPDNRMVATQDRDSRAIWLFDLVRGTTTPLTFEPGFHAVPVWAPDSQSVVYANEPPGGGGWTLSRKAVNGTGAPEVIYQSATPATPTSWSPDGKYLAVAVPGPGAESKTEIWLLPVSSNHKPFPFVQGSSSCGYGHFSPDGRWFLYTAEEAGHTHFYVVSFPGQNGKWQVPIEDATGSAVWLSAHEIAYATGDLRLFAIPVETSGGKVEFGRPQPLLGSEALRLLVQASYNGLWTHDGKRLLLAIPAEASTTPQLNLVTNWTATLKR